MAEFLFVNRYVEHYYWTIEADTLAEACAKWKAVEYDYEGVTVASNDPDEDELIGVIKDPSEVEEPLDLEEVKKILARMEEA
jgi:hypothetical protein